MEAIVFVCLTGVFSYHCQGIVESFKGTSLSARGILSIVGGLGFLSYAILTVWSFWPYDWWIPIVSVISSIVIGGITAPIFQRNIIGMVLSPIATIICSSLSVIYLLNL